jgi:hypothetical protein
MAAPVENPVTGTWAGSLLANVWQAFLAVAVTPGGGYQRRRSRVDQMTLGIDGRPNHPQT